MVVNKVKWPHELVYTATVQPAVYEDLSVTVFVSGYLAIMETVKPVRKPFILRHLKDLMADTEVYGWATVHAYHAVWLQQIENGRAQWMDVDAKLASHARRAKPFTGWGGVTGKNNP